MPDRADPDADEPVDRRPDGAEHPAQLALPALARGWRGTRRARAGGGSEQLASQAADLDRRSSAAGAASVGEPLVEPDARRCRRRDLVAVSGVRTPIAYSRSTPNRGWRTRSAQSPSFVSRSRPSRVLVEPADGIEPRARRARGPSARGRARSRRRGGRASSRSRRPACGAPGRRAPPPPPIGAAVDGDDRALAGSTCWPSVATRPSTVTRPAAISASLARREATPAAARTFWSRSAGISRRVGAASRRRAAGRRPRGGVVGGELAALLGQAGARRRPRAAAARRGSSARTARGTRSRCRTGTAGPGASERPSSTISRRWSSVADRVVGVDAADPLDAPLGHGLAVGDDRQRLERRRRQPDRVGADVARDQRAGLGRGRELDAVAGDDAAGSRGRASDTSRSPSRASTVARSTPGERARSRAATAAARRRTAAPRARPRSARSAVGAASSGAVGPPRRARRPVRDLGSRASSSVTRTTPGSRRAARRRRPSATPPRARSSARRRPGHDRAPRLGLRRRRSRGASSARASRGT